jgi:hypothetical protein
MHSDFKTFHRHVTGRKGRLHCFNQKMCKMGHLGHKSQQSFAGKVGLSQKNVCVGVGSESILHIFELL